MNLRLGQKQLLLGYLGTHVLREDELTTRDHFGKIVLQYLLRLKVWISLIPFLSIPDRN